MPRTKKTYNTASVPKLLMALVASVAAIGMHGADAGQARLLVNIIVDGLDDNYIDILRSQLTEGGFMRLERDGARLTADYGTPVDATAATATLMSGAGPSVTGIGGNTYYDRFGMRPQYAYSDASTLGNYTSVGFSPASLRVSTLSDEMRIASGGNSLVYSVAPTAGTAIGMAGHNATGVVWLDARTGNWASSTAYYDMPASIAARNRLMPLMARLDTMSWTPALASYPNVPEYLSKYPFRHVFPRNSADRLDMFMTSPLLNSEVTLVASDMLRTQKLGSHEGITDVLNIGYSLTPYPYGRAADKRVETMDAYVRLDRDLSRLFSDIDRSVGLDKTVLMLAATPPRPQRRRDEEEWKIPYGEFSTRKAVSLLNVYLMALHGNGDYVSAYHNGHIYLNHKLIKELELDIAAVREEVSQFLARMTGIDRVYTIDAVIAGRAGENPEALKRNTVVSTAGDVLFFAAPGFEVVDDYNNLNPDSARKGLIQTGGSSLAPVYILAPALPAQTLENPVDARAIAPTMARILRIRSPNAAATAPVKLKK